MILKKKTKFNTISVGFVVGYPFRPVVTGSGSGKIHALLNLIKLKDDDYYDVTHKLLYFKNANGPKY